MSSVSGQAAIAADSPARKEKVPAATARDRLGEPGEVERLKVYQCGDYAEFISVSTLRPGDGLTRVAVDGTSLRAA